MLLASAGEVLADGAGDEEDEADGGGDPKGPVEVRVAVEDVEEVGPRVEGGTAAAEDFGGVDIEELGVEGEGPEEAFGGEAVVRGGTGVVWGWEFVVGRGIVEVWVIGVWLVVIRGRVVKTEGELTG